MLQRLLLPVLAVYVFIIPKGIAQNNININDVDVFQLLEFNDAIFANKPTSQPQLFSLGQFGEVELDLYSTSIVGSSHSINGKVSPVLNQSIKTFKGNVANGGAVRLTIDEYFVHGYIEFQNETYWIEPAWYYSDSKVKTNHIVVYKQSDVRQTNEHACGVIETSNRVKSLKNHSENRSVGQCYEVDLAIASDYSMYLKYNSSLADVMAHNVAIINNVNGNYTGEFNDDIEFSIVTQFISNCPTCDPWSSSTNPYTLLNSFSNWGLNGGFGIVHDIGELWTNRDFDGATVGLAWIDQVCNVFKYHVLQDYSMNANRLRVLTAHEIAHNFGVGHDGNPSPYIMAPYVQNTSSWSAASKTVMSATIADLGAAANSCLAPCTSGSPPVAAFLANTTNVCPANSVSFTDLSSDSPTAWYWEFEHASPTTSTAQNPAVIYNAVGNHKVTLTVENNFGTHTLVKNNYIEVGSVPDVEYTFEVDNRVVSFQEQIPSIADVLWNFGDGVTSSLLNPIHTYDQNGTYEVELTASASCGSNSTIMLINIGPCINTIQLNGALYEASHVAGSEIFCGGQVQSSQQIHLHAPNGILLSAGFDMPMGAVLNVTNNGCVD